MKRGDSIWIHDYHMFLLPRLIRTRVRDAGMGFFLHIPFPPYDVFRLLPWHREVLEGLLGADLIGFHTYDYARAFLGSVLRDLGLDNRIGMITAGHRVVQVDVFPLGIDVAAFRSAWVAPSVGRSLPRAQKGRGPSKLLFSVSRLDYTKGIPQQLEAFGRFLEAHPEWRRNVTYLLAVVPSRERVAEYARLKREIDERVGRINSRYGTIAWTPIRYLYRQLDFDERTWAMRFLERLDEAVRFSEDLAIKILSEAEQKEIRLTYRKGKRRLLLLDYDGTLVPFSPDRDAAFPEERVVRVLKDLVSDSANHVVLVSGRPRDALDKWFGGLALTLIAEHGGGVRGRGDSGWEATPSVDGSWKGRGRPVIERYLDRVPGSSLEEKEFALAWPYRAADAKSGSLAAKDLVDVLTTLAANLDLQVLPGDKVVEIRRAGADKGTHFVTRLGREPWDFIFAAGDDWTDEALFAALPRSAFSIR